MILQNCDTEEIEWMNIIRCACNTILANEMLNYCYKNSFAWYSGFLLNLFHVRIFYCISRHESETSYYCMEEIFLIRNHILVPFVKLMKSDSLTFWYEWYSRHLYFLVDVIDKIEIKLHLTSEHVQCINENHITTFNSLIWLPVFNIKNCFDFLSSSYHQHLPTAAESFFLLT